MIHTRPSASELRAWLHETDETRLAELYYAADMVRRVWVGEEVHLRGLIELSNHCVRTCAYCGIRAPNREVSRYRMTAREVLTCARRARDLGYGTVVLQGGEDPGLTRRRVADMVRAIKDETGLAVTLSLGERTRAELTEWRKAGADRYLLRFETSDPALYERIHPQHGSRASDRIADLRTLRELGYQVGSGIMVGIPGQTYESVARDVELFKELDLDMVGIGPYIPHPATPLAREGSGVGHPPGATGGDRPAGESGDDQVPRTEALVYKVLALTRLVCPEANIPSTTALATVNQLTGRTTALQRGANVVMPNLTPATYRDRYLIYPGKATVTEMAGASYLQAQIAAIGRPIARGPGHRTRLGPRRPG